jgi:16S rRNA (adenine1518-N6/adenine1519-N6)-dimethyltransferase
MRRFGLRPDKRLGQNFLIDKASLRKVVEAADLHGDETVLEIGAGLGSLTVLLSQSAHKVITVEFDERLIPALEMSIDQLENVRLVVGNILKLDVEDLLGDQAYCVIANIPYNITSVLIRHLMESKRPPQTMVLTLQKEVAQRIIAVPGELNLLALSVQVYGVPQVVGHIPSRAFYPQPKVDSSIIHINLHKSPIVPPELLSTVFQLTKIGFNQKRKQLRNSLSAGMGVEKDVAKKWLRDAAIDPHSRPQELALEKWVLLAETVINSAEESKNR